MHRKQSNTLPKASCASDISRLLDPAYSSLSARQSSRSLHSAYVDCGGQLHDPDYRHFDIPHHYNHQPPQNAKPKLKNPQDRLHWELEAAALDAEENNDVDLLPPNRRHSFSLSDLSYSSPNSPAFPSTPSLIDDTATEDDSHAPTATPETPKYQTWHKAHSHYHLVAHSPSQTLHKQWLALSLRVRFKVYNMKQRLRKS